MTGRETEGTPSFEIAELAPGVEGPLDLGSPEPLGYGGYAAVWSAGTRGEYVIKSFRDADEDAVLAEYRVLCRLSESGCGYFPKAYCLGRFFVSGNYLAS